MSNKETADWGSPPEVCGSTVVPDEKMYSATYDIACSAEGSTSSHFHLICLALDTSGSSRRRSCSFSRFTVSKAARASCNSFLSVKLSC